MTDNTKSDQKPFFKELVVGMLPRGFVRTSFLFLFRPRPFVNEVKANNWDGKSHPAAFWLASLAIVVVLNPLTGLHSIDSDWYGSAAKMDDERFCEFLEAFSFTHQELQTMHYEDFIPGQTAASRRIEKTVGSLKVSDIAFHLARANLRVAQALRQGADEIKKYDRYIGFLIAPVVSLAWAIGALILHLVLHQASEPRRLAFNLLIYVAGFWLVVSHLTVAFGRFAIPYESSWSLLFSLFQMFCFVVSLIHGSWVCGFVYDRGIGRRLLAYFLAYAAVLPVVIVFVFVLDLVIDYLPSLPW